MHSGHTASSEAMAGGAAVCRGAVAWGTMGERRVRPCLAAGSLRSGRDFGGIAVRGSRQGARARLTNQHALRGARHVSGAVRREGAAAQAHRALPSFPPRPQAAFAHAQSWVSAVPTLLHLHERAGRASAACAVRAPAGETSALTHAACALACLLACFSCWCRDARVQRSRDCELCWRRYARGLALARDTPCRCCLLVACASWLTRGTRRV